MGYVGISGLAKNRNAQTEEKDHCGRYTEHWRCRDIGKMAFAIMAWSTEIQVNCNIATDMSAWDLTPHIITWIAGDVVWQVWGEHELALMTMYS